MAQIDYPVTLTQKDWDKRKPVLAKTKSTGIGDALKALQKMHDAAPWKDFSLKNQMAIASLDGNFEEALKTYGSKVKPIVGHAKSVSTLATTWAGKFTKDKLIPKAAAQAAKAIADAADDYAKKIDGFEKVLREEYAAERKGLEAKLRSVLKPMLTKGVQKVDLFLKDIATLKSNPSKDNLLKLATGDGGARGYCTQCKNWDQFLKDFPDIRDGIFKGSAMQTFFPAAKEYGANHSPGDWDKMLQQLVEKKGISEEEAVKIHANYLVKQVPDITKFKGYLEAALGAVN
jgi:hypothetical protein